ncbi:ABATE domain-containing protein [uncultured Arthrobacter sp.]|uniref:CGNR zinc finger domain-containing protein n=1 Tax=uncultured Arthrobacter sp. TaxID=114050 RepID=UPI002601032C|nr:ABATE domain-containing protein [uncultured Arthrobacter sp.]
MTTTGRFWKLSAEPLPVRLMNTIWTAHGTVRDELQQPADIDDWFRSTGFTPEGVSAAELASALTLRTALRRVAAHASGDSRAAAGGADGDVADAVGTINAALTPAPVDRMALGKDGFRAESEPAGNTVADGLAAVSAQAVALFTAADGSNIRACMAPGCVVYFVKNHPRREWCSVTCGNRSRAARHYRREHDGSAT